MKEKPYTELKCLNKLVDKFIEEDNPADVTFTVNSKGEIENVVYYKEESGELIPYVSYLFTYNEIGNILSVTPNYEVM